MNKLLAIRAFIAVTESGSFSKGGERLGIAPSAVTKLISQLERDLDTRLLNRSTRSMSLNDQGREYYERSLVVMAALEESELAVRASTGILKGRLRVVAPFSFSRVTLVPALHEFTSQHPKLSIDLEMSDRPIDLVEGGFDLAIRSGEQTDSTLVAKLLMRTPNIVVASPRYLEENGTPQVPADLAQHNCLVNRAGSDWPFRDESGQEKRVRVSGMLAIFNADVLREAAVAGLGIARYNRFLFRKDLDAGLVVPILENYVFGDSPVYALYPDARFMPPKVRGFLDFLVDITRQE
jgi:DNA-binding transcriptional LysR family regulator